MAAPDIPPDAESLPAELEGLVTRHDDGELSWTRTVPTPYLPVGVAALGVPALGVFHGLVTLLASSTLGREPSILPIVVACVALVVLANRYLSEHVERVRVGADGISGRHGLRWAEGDTLHLAGTCGTAPRGSNTTPRAGGRRGCTPGPRSRRTASAGGTSTASGGSPNASPRSPTRRCTTPCRTTRAGRTGTRSGSPSGTRTPDA